MVAFFNFLRLGLLGKKSAGTPVGGNFRLLESGDYRLLESGDRRILE